LGDQNTPDICWICPLRRGRASIHRRLTLTERLSVSSWPIRRFCRLWVRYHLTSPKWRTSRPAAGRHGASQSVSSLPARKDALPSNPARWPDADPGAIAGSQSRLNGKPRRTRPAKPRSYLRSAPLQHGISPRCGDCLPCRFLQRFPRDRPNVASCLASLANIDNAKASFSITFPKSTQFCVTGRSARQSRHRRPIVFNYFPKIDTILRIGSLPSPNQEHTTRANGEARQSDLTGRSGIEKGRV
jgi:hypothetical protein